MKKNIIRLTESDLHRIVKSSVGKILRESYNDFDFDDGYDDDELDDELEAAGVGGSATPEDIERWREDLWINLNKTFQNVNYLFNKTRDESYARVSSAVGDAIDAFPGKRAYMERDYDPDEGYGG